MRAVISLVAHSLSPASAAASRHPLGRALDAVLYSSAWLAAAAAAQAAASLYHWAPLDASSYRLVALVFAATLLVYNLDAALPFKHREPAGNSIRKAWQQRNRLRLLALAVLAAVVAGYFFFADGWWRYLPMLAPLVALALLYSWPVWPWRGRPRALREVPLLKGFVIAIVWTAVTVGLPALLRQPAEGVAGMAAQRFALIMVITIVFDIRDYGRDRRAGTRTFPGVLGVPRAKQLALLFLLVSMGLGLARGVAPLAVMVPGVLTVGIVSAAEETRGDYFYALLTDGLLLVQAVAYFMFR